MKQGGMVVLILVLAIALVAGAAVLIHWPGSRSVLEHLHGAPAAANGEAEAAIAARDAAAAIGRRWDAATYAETVSLYTAVHRSLEWPGLLAPEKYRYGPDEQQTLDLFRPEQDFSEPGPVFVFVHGNGLGATDWRIPGSDGLLLTHAGRLAATAGGLGVLMNYRTGEAADAASGADDLRLVIEWLRQNIGPFGGDPDTIVVLGHSDGAVPVAAYLFDESAQPDRGPGIAAAILSSGPFGDASRRLASLVDGYAGERVPLALWRAEYDPEDVAAAVGLLYERLCEKYLDCPWIEQLEGYNHMSQLFSLGTADATVMNAFIRFYHTVR